jgi:hypothetical protein
MPLQFQKGGILTGSPVPRIGIDKQGLEIATPGNGANGWQEKRDF